MLLFLRIYLHKNYHKIHNFPLCDLKNNIIFRKEKCRIIRLFCSTETFIIGIISVALAYILAIPLGVLMALKKDKFVDKLGTFYIIFIMAVPSLGYIFIFRAIGSSFKLPTTFDVQNPTVLMYILPVISLALPSIANLMKWLRRYMIDQMNSDYVKFARSGGLSEGEIFRKHILKNAIIPVVHGIPASILFSMTGASVDSLLMKICPSETSQACSMGFSYCATRSV